MSLVLGLLSLVLGPWSLHAQPTPPTAVSLAVNKTTGAITAPVTPATFASANNLAATTGAITIGPRHMVYCLGDSITLGVSQPPYETQLQTLLGSLWYVNNRGVGGNTTTQMSARLTNQVLAPGDLEYVVVLGGINDINTGSNAASIESNLQAIYTAIHNAGGKVVACTILPFKGYATWNSGTEAIRTAVNTWIQNTATNVDYKADTAYALSDPADRAQLLAAYDSGDHLHPSAAGNVALANAIYAATTWTISTSQPIAYFSGPGTYFNQSLRPDDSPRFAKLGLGNYPDLTRTLNIRPLADEEAILIGQSNDGASGWGIYADTAGAFNLRRYASGVFGSSIFSVSTTGALSISAGFTATTGTFTGALATSVGGTAAVSASTTTYGGGVGSAITLGPDATTGNVGATITSYMTGGGTFGALSLNGLTVLLKSSGSTVGTVSSTGLALANLTAGRVTFATTSGLLTDSAALTFNSGTGALTATSFVGALTGNASTATTLQTARAIYGNTFDGSAALTQIIASTYGGTGNGFTKFSGPAASEKTFTLPNSSATLLYEGGTIGATTPSTGAFTTLSASGLSSIYGSGSGELRFNSSSGSATEHVIASYYNAGAAFSPLTFSAGTIKHYVSGTVITTTSSTGLTVVGTLTTSGGAAFHTTSTALTNGAGAGAGTLTNAPSAGNPTKWIGINDNGTTRYIPAW